MDTNSSNPSRLLCREVDLPVDEVACRPGGRGRLPLPSGESGRLPEAGRPLLVIWRNRSFSKRIVRIAAPFVTVLLAAGALAVQLETLSELDGSPPMGAVGAISTDGSALAGGRWAPNDYLPETFLWTTGTNLIELAPGGASTNPNAYVSSGCGVSDSHEVVVGWKHEGQPAAFALVDGTPVALTANRGSQALGLSRDGTLAIGRDPTALIASSVQAVSWALDSGTPTVLPDLAGGATFASAEAISADKTTIVGWGTDASGRQACRWLGGTVLALGDLPGGRVFSEATAVSSMGEVIVGRSWSDRGIEAFRWSSETGLQGLGDLPGGCEQSEATGVSDDGQVIVGTAYSDLGAEVFVWNAAHGMRSLRTLMKVAGQDISGWHFGSTRPVLSGDGNVLAGSAVDPDQNSVLFRLSGLREMTRSLVTTWMAWRLEGAYLVLRFPTEPGLRYQPQGAGAVSGAAWLPVGDAVVGTGAELEVRCGLSTVENGQFYRLHIMN